MNDNNLIEKSDDAFDPENLTEKDIPKLIWMLEQRQKKFNIHYIDLTFAIRTILIALVFVMTIQTIMMGIYFFG